MIKKNNNYGEILYCLKESDKLDICFDVDGYPRICINGKPTIRFIHEDTEKRGLRSNLIIYEDGCKQENIEEKLLPMIRYHKDENGKLFEPMIICREKERFVGEPFE